MAVPTASFVSRDTGPSEAHIAEYKAVWERRNPYPTLLKVKTIITGVILVPLRLSLLLLHTCTCIPIILLIIKFSGGGATKSHGVRKLVFKLIVWYWLRTTLFLMGFLYIHTSGRFPHTSKIKSSHIIIGNHCGWVEIAYMIAMFMPSIVAKRAVSEMPVLGPITKAINCIFVDRIKTKGGGGGGKVKTTTQKIIDHLDSSDGHYSNLGMFPEGTTTNGSSIVHFRTGAFVPGLPVVPCIFKFKSWLFDPCCCSYRLKHHFLQCLATPFNVMTCQYLDVYYPSEEEKNNADLYALNVHKIMCEKGSLKSRDDMEYADKLQYEASVGYKNSDVKKIEKMKAATEAAERAAGSLSGTSRVAAMKSKIPMINKKLARVNVAVEDPAEGTDSDEEEEEERDLEGGGGGQTADEILKHVEALDRKGQGATSFREGRTLSATDADMAELADLPDLPKMDRFDSALLAANRDSNASTMLERKSIRRSVVGGLADGGRDNLSASFMTLRHTAFLDKHHELSDIVTRKQVKKWNDPTRRRGSTVFFVGST